MSIDSQIEHDADDGLPGCDLESFMDSLTHDTDTPAEWFAECVDGVVETPAGKMSLTLLVSDPCLADPQKVGWKNAFAWRLIELYEDEARVVFPEQSPA